MLSSTIRFGTLLFKCMGTFLHNQNCHAFVYPDQNALGYRNAYDTGNSQKWMHQMKLIDVVRCDLEVLKMT